MTIKFILQKILPRIFLILFLSSSCLFLSFKLLNQKEVESPPIIQQPTQQPITKPQKKPIEKLDQVPYLSQLPEYPNGCEATSATMVLKYYKHDIKIHEFMNYIPTTPIEKKNNKTYGGNPEVTFTGSMIKKGYGIFAPGLTKSLNDYLSKVNSPLKATNITGTDKSIIIQYLNSGTPVIMWITDDYKTIDNSKTHTWYLKENGQYTDHKIEFPLNEHCVVLTNYNDGLFTIHDPLEGVVQKDADQIIKIYNSFNQMAIILEEK